MRGQISNVFKELQAGDSIEELLAFSDNNILIALRQPNDLDTKFAATASEILENHSENFFKQIAEKYTKHRGNCSEFCKVDIFKNKDSQENSFLMRLQDEALHSLHKWESLSITRQIWLFQLDLLVNKQLDKTLPTIVCT